MSGGTSYLQHLLQLNVELQEKVGLSWRAFPGWSSLPTEPASYLGSRVV